MVKPIPKTRLPTSPLPLTLHVPLTRAEANDAILMHTTLRPLDTNESAQILVAVQSRSVPSRSMPWFGFTAGKVSQVYAMNHSSQPTSSRKSNFYKHMENCGSFRGVVHFCANTRSDSMLLVPQLPPLGYTLIPMSCLLFSLTLGLRGSPHWAHTRSSGAMISSHL